MREKVFQEQDLHPIGFVRTLSGKVRSLESQVTNLEAKKMVSESERSANAVTINGLQQSLQDKETERAAMSQELESLRDNFSNVAIDKSTQASLEADNKKLAAENQRLAAKLEEVSSRPALVFEPLLPASPPREKTSSAWNRLEKGMTEDDVRALFGHPDSIDPLGQLHYSSGWVSFDRGGLVDGWQKPFL